LVRNILADTSNGFSSRLSELRARKNMRMYNLLETVVKHVMSKILRSIHPIAPTPQVNHKTDFISKHILWSTLWILCAVIFAYNFRKREIGRGLTLMLCASGELYHVMTPSQEMKLVIRNTRRSGILVCAFGLEFKTYVDITCKLNYRKTV